MLCSEGELELGPDFSGLMRLDPDIADGTPINQALDLSDHVFEIGLTPNRPDCLSFIGIAREAAALTGKALTLPTVEPSRNPGALPTLCRPAGDRDHRRAIALLAAGPAARHRPKTHQQYR